MRPYTRDQTLQNRAFLEALAKAGNATHAAAAVGVALGTFQYRRANHPVFATEWEAALAIGRAAAADPARGRERRGYRITRFANGTVQLRRMCAREIDRNGEQSFLAALSATANVGLSAKAAGFTREAFYNRARIDPGFAREWRIALQTGYERVEFALIHGFTAASHRHDDWRHNDPPDIPPMNPEQAIQQLHLHYKTAKLWSTRPWEKPRRGESTEQWSARMATITRARQRREYEDAEVARAQGRAPEPTSRFEGDMAVYDLSEKLRAEVLASAPPKLQPGVGTVRWAKLRLRQSKEAAAGGEAPAERDVRMRRTGEAMFGGWRWERE